MEIIVAILAGIIVIALQGKSLQLSWKAINIAWQDTSAKTENQIILTVLACGIMLANVIPELMFMFI